MPDKLYKSHSIEKTQSSDGVSTSGTLTLWEDNPQSPYDVGDVFQPVPGGALLTVNKVQINDNVLGEQNGKPLRQWQITIEGSTDVQSVKQIAQIKYTFEIDKDDEGNVFHSGTMEVENTGEEPAFNVNIGDSFTVPGIGSLKCTKLRGGDSYDDKGNHIWDVTYEGSTQQQSSETTINRDKYSFSFVRNSNGTITRSGSIQKTISTVPSNISSKISVPGAGSLNCIKVSGNDEYTSDGKRRWIVTYEGSDETIEEASSESGITYSYSYEENNGVRKYTGSKEFSFTGNTPTLLKIGESFSIPNAGNFTCVRVQVSGNTITYEGERIEAASSQNYTLPDDEESSSYEINGGSTRSVSGELIVLLRSNTPIIKKTFTVYNENKSSITSPGSSYGGGTVISESVSKESIKVDDVEVQVYYRHEIEVEA